jgi:hypothetical protein
LEKTDGTLSFDSDEFPAPEMNNRDRIEAGHWEWELGSDPDTRFCLVYSEVFIDKNEHG